MPWKPADAEEHMKGLTDKQSEAWAKVANSVRARCIKGGEAEEICDARAIKSANAAAKRIKEADVGGKKPKEEIEESDLSHDDTRQKLRHALKAKLGLGGDTEGPWVKEVFDDYLIYDLADKTYQLNYLIGDEDEVTIGDPFEVEVKTAYEPVAAAPAPAPATEAEAMLAGDVIPLNEKAVAADGKLEVKIIQPGWGTSGYYSKEVLARDAAVYKPGTKMYWDHPTESEDRERPERSLRDLAAELTTAGQFKDGISGPGVYAQAQVFGPYREAIEELAPHIGISHRALGKATRGEAEGRKGPIIEKVAAARSVDFVTTPGAGGEVVQLFEAARANAVAHDIDWEGITMEGLEQHRPDLTEGIKTSEEAKRMSEEELTELKEAKEGLEEEKGELTKENERLKESVVLREAHDLAAEKVGESDLPDITKARLTETLAKSPAMKEGELDKDEHVKHIDEAIKGEADYIAKLTGVGAIKGMGSSDGTGSKDKLHESFKVGFMREGKSEEEADRMADIAVLGR